MLQWLGAFIIMLLLVSTAIAAEEDIVNEAQSRFISAEAQRLIKSEFAELDKSLKAYQDENFIALDGEMRRVITDSVQKMVIGTLGAVLLAGAAIAILMFKLSRKYSYEKFLEKELQQQTEMYQDQGLQQMQQQEFAQQQQPFNTIGMDQGQSFASDSSAFSNWQVQPPHQGGWQWQGGQK
ncbi:hypothetical protein GOV11_03540 [Candidatus Woesearchaeota archaeon]|nr:hypothetical protein [Candidatus Woesearchaeota archaeon]